MTTLSRPLHRLIIGLACLVTLAATTKAQQITHERIHATPAPETVTIDGRLDEWDGSGAIYVAANAEAGYLNQSAWVYAMHDDDALYIATRVLDSTPLNSDVNPAISTHGWRGDCLQVRLKADQVSHFTTWYFAAEQQPAMHVSIGRKPSIDRAGLATIEDEANFTNGAAMSFAAFDQPVAGYVQEMRLPWSLITGDGRRPGGDTLGFVLQLFFDNTDNVVADVIRPDTTSKTRIHNFPKDWGELVLVDAPRPLEADPALQPYWGLAEPPQVGQMCDADFLDAESGYITGIHGILRTEDGGMSWRHTDIPIYALWELSAPSRAVAYAVGNGAKKYAYESGLIMGTRDGGTTWQALHAFGRPLRRVSFADDNAGWVADDRWCHYTTNGGQSWQRVHGLSSRVEKLLAIDHQTALAALEDGTIARTTSGNSWSVVAQIDDTPSALTPIAGTDGLLLTGNQAVWRSLDRGQTWQRVRTPAGAEAFAAVATADAHRWAVLARQDEAGLILETLDAGATWQVLHTFAPRRSNSMRFDLRGLDYIDGNLWVVGGGMTGQSQVSTVMRFGDGRILPDKGAGVVPLAYELDQKRYVTLVIEDAQGKRVRNLISDQPRSAGRHVERWDGRDDRGELMPPGDYRWRGLTHRGLHTFYEFSYYNPGQPAWNTGDGTGNWGSDHGPPQDVTSVGDRVVLCWPFYEAGWGVVGTDLNGKRGGFNSEAQHRVSKEASRADR